MKDISGRDFGMVDGQVDSEDISSDITSEK